MSVRPPASEMTDSHIDHNLDRLSKLVHEAASVSMTPWGIRAALSKLPEIIEISLTLTHAVIIRVRRLEAKK